MRAILFLSLAAGLLSAYPASADDVTAKPELKAIQEALQPTLKKLSPAAKVEFDDNNKLRITYLPQTFKIHGVSLSGDISAEAHDEVGPSARGCILSVHLQDKGTINMAVTPQTLRRPYWLTDLDVTPIAKSDQQMYWALSYGTRMDAKLLDEIRATLRAMND